MKRASQIINDIQNNKADSLFLDIYQDESMIEFQKKRYVDAIEQYINLYKDEEVEIFSVLEEVKYVEIIQIINMVKF